MDHFQYQDNQLYVEDIPVKQLAQHYGTPLFIYSKATLERHWLAFETAFGDRDHLICYAVKANSNLAVLQTLARLGSGFDVVSGGEIQRALIAGADPQKIVFSGIGKTSAEIEYALQHNIACFNVESAPELARIAAVAERLGIVAPISIRVNPDVDAQTHPYISTGLKENKFGVTTSQAMQLYQSMNGSKWLNPIGVDCHIGSQLTELEPFLQTLDILLRMIDQLREQGIYIEHLDLGGGLGVPYHKEQPPHPSEFAAAVAHKMDQWQGAPVKLILEPGRAIAANAGILVTQVEFIKITEYKNFLIVDAAMNDLIRPSLYNAWQNIIPVVVSNTETSDNSSADKDKASQAHKPHTVYDIVGPVCESGDFLGKDRELGHVEPGDYFAVRSAGAYGFCMSSNYNTRNRAAELLVDKTNVHVARRRETFEDQLGLESLLP